MSGGRARAAQLRAMLHPISDGCPRCRFSGEKSPVIEMSSCMVSRGHSFAIYLIWFHLVPEEVPSHPQRLAEPEVCEYSEPIAQLLEGLLAPTI